MVLGGNSSPKERIEWLDVTRGLAFMMVIYQHMTYCNETIMKYFTPVFLTTFFSCQGISIKVILPLVRSLNKEREHYCGLYYFWAQY